MITNAVVPSFDIEAFKGVSVAHSFQTNNGDEDGVIVDPFDLAGKTIYVILSEILGEELALSSDDPANDNGSYVEITSGAGGEWNFDITGNELAVISKSDGYWRAEVREGLDATLLVRGAFRILPYIQGGS